jgi:serine/threonine-protein kinase
MNESKEAALIGRTIAGKFLIESFIGGGAMGAVYKARQIALDKIVAIKVMHPDRAEDAIHASLFQREAKAASRLDHPNSVRVVDFGQELDGLLYIAMEYFAGRDLQRVLADEWPISTTRVSDILSQALAAIAVAHEMGIVHRDLKPENILVQQGHDDEGIPHDVVKVCDFGIAKITEAGEAAASRVGPRATEGLVFGTPHYMAPEQAQGGTLDARTDVYAMGVILYQMLTSRVPFDGKTLVDVAIKHVHEEPIPPTRDAAWVDARLEAICLKALRKKKEDRYQSARQMRADLKAVMAAPASVPEMPRAPVSRDAPTLPPEALRRTASNVTPAPTTAVPQRRRHAALLPAGILVAVVGATAVGLRARPWHAGPVVASPPLENAVVSSVGFGQPATMATEKIVGLQVPSSPMAPVMAPRPKEGPRPNPHNHAKSTAAASPTDSMAAETDAVESLSLGDKRERPLGLTPLSAAAIAAPAASGPPVAPVIAVSAPGATAEATTGPPTRVFDPSRARVTWSVAATGGGATVNDVRRSLTRASGAWNTCYQNALRTAGQRVEGSATLHIATDEEGNVIQATVTGFALSGAETCIAASARVRIAGVDTGSAWADVKLAFRAEASE